MHKPLNCIILLCFIVQILIFNKRKADLDVKNQELQFLDSKIKDIEGNLHGLETQLSLHKFKSQMEEYQYSRKEQNDLLNSYIKSIISEGQDSLILRNSKERLSNNKNSEVKKEKVCLCVIF